jgi:hypothetical protein
MFRINLQTLRTFFRELFARVSWLSVPNSSGVKTRRLIVAFGPAEVVPLLQN